MNLIPNRRTSANTRKRAAKGLVRAKRSRNLAVIERLEDRAVPAALLDIIGGVLVYQGSAVANNLTISDSSPSGSGQYFFNDTGEIINLGPGAVALLWTGGGTNTVQGPDGSVNAMLIDTDGGNDVVNLSSLTDPVNINTDVGVPDTVNIGNAGNVDGVLGDVFVQDTGGVGNININDFNNPNPKNINFNNAIGAQITGVLPAGHTINYGAGVTQIDFNGGFGGNTIGVNMPTNDTLDLLNINSGDGSDTVTVTAVNAGLTLNINTEIGGADATNIGTGTLDNILGFVTVQDSGGVSTLTLDDSADPSGRTVSFTNTAANGFITGATPNPIVYQPGVTTLNYNGGTGSDALTVNMPVNDDLGTFNLNSGGGDDTNNIQVVNAGLTVNVNSQNGVPDTTNIGSTAPNLATSTLALILGTVNVQDSGGVGTLNISDAGNALPEFFNLTNSQLTSTAFPGLITYGAGITDLRLDGGSGGNQILVSSTKAGTSTLINSGNGDDDVNVVSTDGPLTIEGQNGQDTVDIGNFGVPGLPGTVQNINGQVTLRKTGSGVLDATVDDTTNAAVTNANLIFNAGTGFAELSGQSPALIRYMPDELGTLTINTGAGNDSVNVNFINGNPIAFGPTNASGGLEYNGQGQGLLNLFNDLPTGPFFSEDSVASGPGAGDIDFVDSAFNATHISYSGLSPVNDTTSVINYTFTTPAFPAQNVSVTDTVVNGFNGTRISEAANQFERQDIANKRNVTINVGTPFTLVPIDVSVLLNNPNATTGAHNLALLSMTINTFAGNDAIQIVATPAIPNVSVTTDGGDDTVNVLGAGVPAGTLLFLDGGPGLFDTLNYDAGGAAVVVTPGPAPGEVIITGPNGTVDAINFESIVITNAAPTPPVISAPLTVNSVEGFQLVDVDVATFTSAAPGAKASDFTATIDWGDGSPVTAGVIVQDAGNPSLFYVRGTHIYREQGSFTVNTTLSSTGSTSTTTVNGVPVTIITGPSGPVGPTPSATVTVSNAALVLTVNPISGVEGTAIPTSVVANFIDLGGVDPANPNPAGDYTATIDWGDGTITVVPAADITQIGNTNEFQITGSHTYAEEGTFAVVVTVTDADLPAPLVTVTGSAPAFIADAALTPAATPAIAAVEGQPLAGVAVATFTDANPTAPISDFTAIIYWGDGTTSAGTITQPGGIGTPFVVLGSHTYLEEGSFNVTAVITDEGGSTTDTTATPTVATVADAPLTTPTAIPVAAVEGVPLNGIPVGTFVDTNPFATAADFTVTINWGDATTTPGVVTLVGGSAAGAIFQVSGSHTYNTPGAFAISASVTDAGGSTTTIASSATVADAPITAQGATVTGTEGLSTGSVLVATFTDSDPSAVVGDFTASINWGDGTTTAGTITAVGSPNGVVYEVRGTHTYAEEGTFAVNVTISDSFGSTAVASGQAVIADAPLTTATGVAVSATEGTTLSGVPVLTFVDTNPVGTVSDFTATIDWGDGTTSLGTITQPGGVGTPFTVLGSHTYIEEGSFAITVVVNDVGGQSITGTTTATVADAPLSAPTGIPVGAVEGQPLNAIPVGTFADGNPFATAADFTVTINWGDGTTTPGVVTLVGGSATTAVFQVTGSHAYQSPGSFAISAVVTDAGGSTTTINTTATVADAPLTAQGTTITATEGLSTGSVLVATFTDSDPSAVVGDFTASINWGDGTTTAGTITAVGSPNGVIYRVNGTHTYAEEGTFAVNVTISDSFGSNAVASGQAVIADAPLTTATGVAVSATEGTALVNVPVLTFVDTNPGGTISDFTATIDWGDGTISVGTITQPGGVGTPFTVTGNHTYVEEGSYPIKVVVNDVGGESITGTTTATVADAPLTTPVGIPVAAQEGSALVDVPLGTFIDTNKFATAGDFSVSINWGDGTPADTTTGTVTLVGGTATGLRFRVNGSHTFATAGSHTVTATVTDVGGATTTIITTTATVAAAPVTAQGATLTGTEGLPLTNVLVATFTSANPAAAAGDFTATINWGDGTTSAGTITKVGSPNGSVFQVTGSHTYIEEGNYTVTTTINETAGGTVGVALGSAIIGDAALTAGVQPVVSATEASVFSGPVATFTDANPFAPISDFTAVIDWGDGTPNTLGLISQPGGPGTPFVVSGTHTFADAGVNGGTGTFPITVNVVDRGGATVTINNTANVADRILVVNGILDRGSDKGQSNTDGITNVTHPRFFGFTTEPNATVFLYAQPVGGGPLQLIGQGVSDASRRWSITSDFLEDGRYNIFVQAVDSAGNTESELTPVALPNGVVGPITIDTVGPKVTNVAFARLTGQVFVTYQDELSGLKQASLIDANNYAFSKLSGPGHVSKFRTNFISAIPRGPLSTTPQTIGLTFNDARQIRGGSYLFTIRSLSARVKNGIQDVAGNALDGEFYGFFPSGNNVRGGDFVAQLDAKHNRVFAPRTVIGRATPVSPPGTLGSDFFLNRGPQPTLQATRVKARVRPNQ